MSAQAQPNARVPEAASLVESEEMFNRSIVVLACVALIGSACDRLATSTVVRRPAEVVFAEWRSISDDDKRLPLAREIVRDGHLIDLSPARVVKELGEPNPRKMSAGYGDIKYVVGPSGVDDLWLCIHVLNGTVSKTEIRSD